MRTIPSILGGRRAFGYEGSPRPCMLGGVRAFGYEGSPQSVRWCKDSFL